VKCERVGGLVLLILGQALLLACAGAPEGDSAALTGGEQMGEWKPLFDGKSLAGWRGFRSETPPSGWAAIDGTLTRQGSGGDILTTEEFGDFELRLQWKIAEGGNSGIFFRVTTEGSQVWESGPEMQILDNARHVDGKSPLTSNGANYGLHAPLRDVTRPVGEWNDVALLVSGPRVEHWLNGVKIVEYELWSPAWETLVKASKFGTLSAYGRATRGHVALQDHGDPVWFRDIRIRPM
jgi:hypothetical protein